MQIFVEVVRYVSTFSVTIPLLIYYLVIDKIPKPNIIIGQLLVISAIADLILFFLSTIKYPNAIVANIFEVVQFCFLLWFYYELMFKKSRKIYFYLGAMIFLFTFSYTTFFGTGLFEYQNLVWSIEAVIIVIYIVIYFNYLAKSKPMPPQREIDSWFIINGGILFYFSFNILLFYMINYLVEEMEPDVTRTIWSFHNINNITKNIMIAIGFAYYRKV